MVFCRHYAITHYPRKKKMYNCRFSVQILTIFEAIEVDSDIDFSKRQKISCRRFGKDF